MATERNRALVQLFFREISENRAKVAFDLVASSAVVHDLSRDLVWSREEELEHIQSLRAAFPDMRIEDLRTVSDGGKIGLVYTLRGTHLGPLEGIPATGHRVELHAAALMRLADARIVEMHTVRDARSMLRQLGVLGPSNRGASERPPPPKVEQVARTSTFAPVTREIVRRFYAEAVGQGDASCLDQIAHEDVLDDPPPPFARSVGRAALGETLRTFRAALEGFRVEVRDVVVQGDSAFVHARYQGDSRGELFGLPATGRRVSWSALELLDVSGSKLRIRRPLLDGLSLTAQFEDPTTRHAGTLRLSRIEDD